MSRPPTDAEPRRRLLPSHAYVRHGILEDLDTVRRIRVGRVAGVVLQVTPLAWIGPLLFLALGLALSFLHGPMGPIERLAEAVIFAIAVEIATIVHAAGHIASGTLVGGPMDALLRTATRAINVYLGDQSAVPRAVHLGRSIGGPAANLAVAGLAALATGALDGGAWHALASRSVTVNLFFGLGGLLPVAGADGEVIWREVRGLWRERAGGR